MSSVLYQLSYAAQNQNSRLSETDLGIQTSRRPPDKATT